MSMEIYADPRAHARTPRPGATTVHRRDPPGAHGRPGHPPRRIPPAPAGLWSVQTSLHGARSAHSRSERRRQVASFDGDAEGATSRSPRPSSRGAGAGRSEQMRITSHTYIHNLSGNDYPHRIIAYEQSLRRIRPRLHCQRPSHLVSESAELFHLVMIHGNCS